MVEVSRSRFVVPALAVVGLLLGHAAVAVAQPRERDVVPGVPGFGDVVIWWGNHATFSIGVGDNTQGFMAYNDVVEVDPVANASFRGFNYPTLILVTDIHPDHFDAATIAKRKTSIATVIAPAAAKLEGAVVLANGETRKFDRITVEAVPMYNLTRGPAAGQLYHDKGRGNGYVITMAGKRVYVAGDTECTPEMKALKNIDVAFIPMNLPYTMSPSEAAACVKAFMPTIVYPYHYQGSDPKEFAAALAGTGIDVRLRDWYPPAAGTAAR
jgi:L-ascorbate metabolism protein UlaG (beta-lactamase superfamily)